VVNDQRPLYSRLIKTARETRLFLSQQGLADLIEELAARDGVTLPCDQSTVSRWERGDCVPALRFRRYIGDALGVDPAIVFTEQAA
jgi:transcriptional regulator with XRE-family HTH domain